MEGSERIVLLATLVLTLLTNCSKAEGDVTGLDLKDYECFTDVDKLYDGLKNDDGRAYCIKQNPDKDSSCFKICMFRETDIITRNSIPDVDNIWDNGESAETQQRMFQDQVQQFNFTFHALDLVYSLLEYYYPLITADIHVKDPRYIEAVNNFRNPARKCEAINILASKQESECSLFLPESLKKAEELKDCIEEALKCVT